MGDKRHQKCIKRLLDVVVSLFVLIIFLPLWGGVATLIKATSEGPVFFLQERPGIRKKIFKVLKFRTMRPGSEKMVKGKEVMNDDDRITSFGKFLRRSKVDEIPQILNVLKGDMSLVGPRPERVASLEDYTDEISRRLNMKPGLTGLAQVSGNIHLSLENRYNFDIYYVDNYSLWLDFKIIFRTVGVVIFGEEVYVNRCLVDINRGKAKLAATKEETVSK